VKIQIAAGQETNLETKGNSQIVIVIGWPLKTLPLIYNWTARQLSHLSRVITSIQSTHGVLL